jgi:DNA ligase-1
LAIVNIFERVSAVSGRLEKENLFCKLFRAVILMTPSDLIDVVYLVSNTVAPAFEGLELGIGESLLVKAVCESTGRNKGAVEEEYNREGDLGVVAQNSRSNQKTLSFASKPTPLLASHVLKQFRLITQTKGDKAQQKKVEIIKGLMVKGQGAEVKYIVRALQGNLRTGSAKQTALVSLAQAFVHSPTPAVRDLVLTDNGKEKLPGYVDVPEDEGDNGEEDENGGSSSSSSSSSSSKGFFSPKKALAAPAPSSAPAAAAGAAGSAEAETGMQVADPSAAVEAEGADLSVLVSRVRQVEPAEAKKLRRTSAGKAKSSLGKEEREELAVAAVKRAFADCPSYALLCEALLTRPLYQLYLACRLVPGVPVSPMLAKPTKEIGEVLRRLSGLAFTMEYKYDGERAQVHLLPDGSVKIFSRNSLDDTNKYPDLAEVIRRAKNDKIESCVIDCEVVAFDREKGCLLPFQILSTRKRKVEDGEEDAQKVSSFSMPVPAP